jgi:hypothetical protein
MGGSGSRIGIRIGIRIGMRMGMWMGMRMGREGVSRRNPDLRESRDEGGSRASGSVKGIPGKWGG